MLVKEVMTKEVRACLDTDTANEAARIMWEGDFGCVPVVNSSQFVVGMVTDRDLCMAAYTRGVPLSAIPVSGVMAPHVYCCTTEDTIEQAEAIMRLRQVRRLPVYDMTVTLVGILSMSDVIRAAANNHHREDGVTAESVEATLEGVGQPRAPHATRAA